MIRERASVLRYTHVACLVCTDTYLGNMYHERRGIDFLPQRNSLLFNLKDQSVNAVGEVITVCSEIHTKYTSQLCQNTEFM
jgi:hypothetical protein